MSKSILWLWIVGVAAMLSLPSAAPAQQYTPFDPPGSVATEARDVGSHGQIVGSYTDSSGVTHGFLRQQDGSFITIDAANSVGTITEAINAEGEIVGHYRTGNDSGCHAFLRKKDGTVVFFDPGGATATIPTAINEKGEIAGYYYDNTGRSHGFLRRARGAITSFDPPKSILTYAHTMNAEGEIAGYYHDPTGDHGFVRRVNGNITTFDATGPTVIGPTPNVMWVYGMNSQGAVVGDYMCARHLVHGFLRDKNGTFVSFDAPGASSTVATAIDSRGEIVGYSTDASGQHGFVRHKDGTFTLFDPTGSRWTMPQAMNSREVVGFYTLASGGTHGFLRSSGKSDDDDERRGK